jgi:hypothetical protein
VPGPDWNFEVFSGAGCTGIPVEAGETDDDGRVIFTVPAGEYSMSELMRPGWERVSAQACQAGAVGANQEIRRTFVNRRIPNGDVNGDGTTNSLDCVLVLQIVAALLDADDVEESARADVNEDDTIDTRDAALILQLDAGFIDELPLP